MNEVEKWHANALTELACKALEKNGFTTHAVETGKDALALLEKFLVPGMTVGTGGSMTLKDIGVPALLEKTGVKVLNHGGQSLTPEQKMETMRAQLTCDLFLSSSNAVTLDGEILNIDGNGNRVAALTFGPKKTVVIIGANKLVRNLDEAHARLETVAAPMNNKRLSMPNPCTKSGICCDCQGDSRVCRIYTVLKRRPRLSDFTVIIVAESLGY